MARDSASIISLAMHTQSNLTSGTPRRDRRGRCCAFRESRRRLSSFAKDSENTYCALLTASQLWLPAWDGGMLSRESRTTCEAGLEFLYRELWAGRPEE